MYEREMKTLHMRRQKMIFFMRIFDMFQHDYTALRDWDGLMLRWLRSQKKI